MDDLVVKLDLWRRLRAQLEGFGGSSTERQHWMALHELVPQSQLAEMQTKVELDSFATRLEFECRRESYHSTLAQRTKFPSVVDSGGDALMAAMSVAVHQESSGGNLADVVSSLQQHVLALQSDQGSAGDIDARGKGGGKEKKGSDKRGDCLAGDIDACGEGGGINASCCWWRLWPSSQCVPRIGCPEWSARCREERCVQRMQQGTKRFWQGRQRKGAPRGRLER